jgi:hypothetical protein
LIVTFAIMIASGAYLYITAVQQHRDFFLKIEDEHSYAIQARMLAGGRLWLPAHPAAESFDAPALLVQPVYASMYFPGTALALVPFVWLGCAWWVGPLAMSAAATGALYRVTCELLDGVSGLLSALLLVSLSLVRELSLRLYSQVPMMLGVLCLMWAWLVWRRRRDAASTVLCGAIAGWLVSIRPLDAIAFVVPVAIAAAVEVRNWRGIARFGAIALVGAMPFVAMQLIANRGITGRWTQTPHAFYAERDFPGMTIGFHSPSSVDALVTRNPAKRREYAAWAPMIAAHTPASMLPQLFQKRLPLTASASLPNNLLLVLIPPALLAMDRRRRVLAAPIVLFLLLYMVYPFYTFHYVNVIAPCVIVALLCGVRAIEDSWSRWRRQLGAMLMLSLALLAIIVLPQFDRLAIDDRHSPELAAIDTLLHTCRSPAIVLFPDGAVRERAIAPVFNSDAADIDDAPVIRAHDLPGEDNRRLFDYYAQRQPGRVVYRYDNGQLVELGSVAKLGGSL